MKMHDATEQAYKNGYEAGFKEGYEAGFDVGKRHAVNEDRCVCCGETIPEGQWVCPNCLVTVKRVY